RGGAGGGGAAPRARGGYRAVLLGGGAGDRGARGRGVGRGAALRPPAGVQALHPELPPRGRRRRRGGVGARGAGGVGPPRHQQPRAAGDPRRRAPRAQLPRRRRRAPPLQLSVGDHRARGRVGGRRRGGVVRGGRAPREHRRRDAHLRGHHRAVQPPVAGAHRLAARR
ncbi:hypothetical protein CFC21_007799, partial [Triticum aestivum]